MAREPDWALFEKAVEITASAVRGALGQENSHPPAFAGDVLREVWGALKEISQDLPDKNRSAGF